MSNVIINKQQGIHIQPTNNIQQSKLLKKQPHPKPLQPRRPQAALLSQRHREHLPLRTLRLRLRSQIHLHSIIPLLRDKRIPIRLEIHLVQADKLCALDEFPPHEHHKHNGNLDVVRDEVDGLEGRAETRPSLDEDEHDVQADGDDRPDGVGPVLERKEMLQALAADGGAEAQGRETDADP